LPPNVNVDEGFFVFVKNTNSEGVRYELKVGAGEYLTISGAPPD